MKCPGLDDIANELIRDVHNLLRPVVRMVHGKPSRTKPQPPPCRQDKVEHQLRKLLEVGPAAVVYSAPLKGRTNQQPRA